MSTTARIIFYALIGVCGGLLAWPITELPIYFQGSLYSQFLLSIILGAVFGLLMGGAFGMSEGIIQKSFKKLLAGLVTGLIVGALGGALGLLAGQQVATLIGTGLSGSTISSPRGLAYPAAKAVGWAALGVFIGIVEGVRTRSFAKIRNGFIGGLLGGFVGGFVFETLIRLPAFETFPALPRVIGYVILGFFIGLFYGLVESRMAKATLLALNGPSKGQEILVTQSAMTIGGEEDADMTIAGYTQVAPQHAVIRRQKGDIILQDKNSKAGTFVNDKKITQTIVENGDVIRIGDAQFLMKKK
jgi:hypothetical protein